MFQIADMTGWKATKYKLSIEGDKGKVISREDLMLVGWDIREVPFLVAPCYWDATCQKVTHCYPGDNGSGNSIYRFTLVTPPGEDEKELLNAKICETWRAHKEWEQIKEEQRNNPPNPTGPSPDDLGW